MGIDVHAVLFIRDTFIRDTSWILEKYKRQGIQTTSHVQAIKGQAQALCANRAKVKLCVPCTPPRQCQRLCTKAIKSAKFSAHILTEEHDGWLPAIKLSRCLSLGLSSRSR